jgi:hypothetical protein
MGKIILDLRKKDVGPLCPTAFHDTLVQCVIDDKSQLRVTWYGLKDKQESTVTSGQPVCGQRLKPGTARIGRSCINHLTVTFDEDTTAICITV